MQTGTYSHIMKLAVVKHDAILCMFVLPEEQEKRFILNKSHMLGDNWVRAE